MKGYTYECDLRKYCHYEHQKGLCNDEDFAMCIHYPIILEELDKHEIRYQGIR